LYFFFFSHFGAFPAGGAPLVFFFFSLVFLFFRLRAPRSHPSAHPPPPKGQKHGAPPEREKFRPKAPPPRFPAPFAKKKGQIKGKKKSSPAPPAGPPPPQRAKKKPKGPPPGPPATRERGEAGRSRSLGFFFLEGPKHKTYSNRPSPPPKINPGLWGFSRGFFIRAPPKTRPSLQSGEMSSAPPTPPPPLRGREPKRTALRAPAQGDTGQKDKRPRKGFLFLGEVYSFFSVGPFFLCFYPGPRNCPLVAPVLPGRPHKQGQKPRAKPPLFGQKFLSGIRAPDFWFSPTPDFSEPTKQRTYRSPGWKRGKHSAHQKRLGRGGRGQGFTDKKKNQ